MLQHIENSSACSLEWHAFIFRILAALETPSSQQALAQVGIQGLHLSHSLCCAQGGWVGAHPSMAPSVAPWARKHHRAPSPDLPTTSPAVPGSAPTAQGLNLWGAGNSICQNMAILFRPQVVYQSKDK